MALYIGFNYWYCLYVREMIFFWKVYNVFFDVKVVAGFPIPLNNDELAQDIEVLKMLCPHPDSSYLIRVQGRSMIEAGVNDGDIIIVDKSERNPTEKQIAVCELNGEYILKRV